jgi:type VII secretion effector (TIGR04197 family)
MAIKSDFTGASQKATALKSATDKLIQSASITEDTKTTVAGNTNAQEAIATAQETATQIAQAIFLASSNLQSVAKEFEALDQKVALTMMQPFGRIGK